MWTEKKKMKMERNTSRRKRSKTKQRTIRKIREIKFSEIQEIRKNNEEEKIRGRNRKRNKKIKLPPYSTSSKVTRIKKIYIYPSPHLATLPENSCANPLVHGGEPSQLFAYNHREDVSYYAHMRLLYASGIAQYWINFAAIKTYKTDK